MYSYKITFQGQVSFVIANSRREALEKAGLINSQSLDLIMTRQSAGLLKNFWE